MSEHWLLADVGGTNTRVGLATPDGLLPDTLHNYSNADFTGLAQVLATYLRHHNARPGALCAGVAGPVRGNTAQLTNLDWFIDSTELRKATGVARVTLINDLQAQGYALDDLPSGSITALIPGPSDRNAPRLVMGLGTGCNIAVVHRTPTGLFAPPSESGHTTLPHMDDQTNALIAHLARAHPHKPVEAALSGPGLSRIHAFLSGITLTPAQIIAAHESSDPDAGPALRLFTRLLGTVLGNFALNHLPMGGIYLIGGTARAVAPFLSGLGFADSFAAKGPYRHILQEIPLSLITDDHAALRGCLRCLLQSDLTIETKANGA
ncbi:Glucokinase [Roseovarius litorisediminis]|uniref:Glucokinase n=1 Tax=Roseovarius litorisediminis TaxID=1312363 RepID=A0A1Y5TSD8_9RHOB|nr:glucokinase [Roseovarius litorisediminis]SLN68527.1 Glucokinase [Roseovarius litorisediminis]